MDAVEIVATPNKKKQAGIVSSGSYNDPIIVANDSGSAASGSLHASALPQSPARPQLSMPSSPAASINVSGSVTTPQVRNFDLLDTPDPYAQGHPSSGGAGGFVSSDDDHTEPSSSATGNTSENPAGYTRSDTNGSATSTFGKIIESTRRRMNTGDRRRSCDDDDDDDDDDDEMMESALIYGFLQKLGRNGKWQTRWFETDGECLTYYKSSKRSKLLATLDLAKVGSIVINRQDQDGASFTINIQGRPYNLRADSKAACKDWVITLNRVKEACMQEGNVKLVTPPSKGTTDLLDHNYAPRIVVIANRERTRAVDDEDIKSWEKGTAWSSNPVNPANDGRRNHLAPSSSRLGRWQKPRNSLVRLANKLAKWARSIRKNTCLDAENHVVLDHHLHPPGHDDTMKRSTNSSSPTKGAKLDGDSTDRSTAANQVGKDVASLADGPEDEDDGIRHLS